MTKPTSDSRMPDLLPVQELDVVLKIPLDSVRKKLEHKVQKSASWSGLKHKYNYDKKIAVRCANWPAISTLQKLVEDSTTEAYCEKYKDD